MIKFGTGGWRAIIGEEFTKENIQKLALAMSLKIKAEHVEDKPVVIGYDRRCLIRPQNSGSYAFQKPQPAGNTGQQHSGRTVFESKKKKKTIRNVH